MRLCALGIAAFATSVQAAQTVKLPDWVCSEPDAVFNGGFDDGAAIPRDPSGGTGGAIGSVIRTVHVTGLGTGSQYYYVYVPVDYTPQRSWPLMLVLHGYGPYPDTYASTTRDNWISAANAGHFIVVAPVAHDVVFDSQCGCNAVSWLVPPSTSATDYDEFAAIRADMESAYNIERTRIYGWGFSAGGMVMYDLGVNSYSTAFNASTMAAYSVSSGDLAGLACTGVAECGLALASLSRKIPVDIHVGTSDPNYTYAQSDHALFLAQGWSDSQTMFYTPFSGGHTYTLTQLGQIWQNLCPSAVTP